MAFGSRIRGARGGLLLPTRGVASHYARGVVAGRLGESVQRALIVKGVKQRETGVSWRKIKAEYIAGGISQRALAEKYGVPWGTMRTRANKEKWNAKRIAAEKKAMQNTERKTAEEVADNAVMLQRIKSKLLKKLDGMIDDYPDKNVAEMRKKENGALLIYRMKDIAAVYAALEDKTFKASVDVEDLSPLVELLRDE